MAMKYTARAFIAVAQLMENDSGFQLCSGCVSGRYVEGQAQQVHEFEFISHFKFSRILDWTRTKHTFPDIYQRHRHHLLSYVI